MKIIIPSNIAAQSSVFHLHKVRRAMPMDHRCLSLQPKEASGFCVHPTPIAVVGCCADWL